MNRARLVGISSVVTAMFLVGGCGSATNSKTSPTIAPGTKLDLATGGGTSAPSAGPAIFPVRPTRYVLDANLADLATSAAVWRMVPHSVNADDVQHFADVLGLTGSSPHTSAGWEVQDSLGVLSFIITDGDVTASYTLGAPNSAGGSAGSTGTATSPSAITNGLPQAAPSPPPSVSTPVPLPTPTTAITPSVPPVDVPGDAEATSIARALLNRLGVLDGHDWSSVATDSGGVAVACAVGSPCPSIPSEASARTVTFSLTLAGTHVHGGEWSVTIGEHRRIESVNGEWATPTAINTYPLRSTAAVFDDLQQGTAKYPGPQPMTAMSSALAVGAPATATIPAITVHVTGVAFGIARWDADTNGHTVVDLVPTYRFHAQVDGGTAYDIEVLALDPGSVTFTNPAPTPQPLPAGPTPAPSSPPAPAEP